jgi:hypothetical protein
LLLLLLPPDFLGDDAACGAGAATRTQSMPGATQSNSFHCQQEPTTTGTNINIKTVASLQQSP